jgi:hypothetical protein
MSANTINQMSAIRAELLESHIRITTKNEALILELKAQIEALILENEAHEDEIASINDLQDSELAWIAEPPEPEGEFIGFVGDVCWENKKAMEERDKKMDEDRAKRQAERESEEKMEAWGDEARQVFQAAEAVAELRRRATDREDENKVCCDKCELCHERGGYTHNHFRYNEDGEYGICGYCYDGEYDEDSEDEEKPWWQDEENCCKCDTSGTQDNPVEYIMETQSGCLGKYGWEGGFVCYDCLVTHDINANPSLCSLCRQEKKLPNCRNECHSDDEDEPEDLFASIVAEANKE